MSGQHQFPLIAIVVLAGVLGPRAAQAQRAAPAAGPSIISARNSSPSVALARPGGKRTRNFDSFSTASTFGAPQSLSFDLFGANQDLGIKAAIDPATEWRMAVAERFDRERRHFFGPVDIICWTAGERMFLRNQPEQSNLGNRSNHC